MITTTIPTSDGASGGAVIINTFGATSVLSNPPVAVAADDNNVFQTTATTTTPATTKTTTSSSRGSNNNHPHYHHHYGSSSSDEIMIVGHHHEVQQFQYQYEYQYQYPCTTTTTTRSNEEEEEIDKEEDRKEEREEQAAEIEFFTEDRNFMDDDDDDIDIDIDIDDNIDQNDDNQNDHDSTTKTTTTMTMQQQRQDQQQQQQQTTILHRRKQQHNTSNNIEPQQQRHRHHHLTTTTTTTTSNDNNRQYEQQQQSKTVMVTTTQEAGAEVVVEEENSMISISSLAIANDEWDDHHDHNNDDNNNNNNSERRHRHRHYHHHHHNHNHHNHNHFLLMELIVERNFEQALKRVQKFPNEASLTWYDYYSAAANVTAPANAAPAVTNTKKNARRPPKSVQSSHSYNIDDDYSYSSRGMNLPLHEACRYQAPPALISVLIDSYENACSHIGQWGYMPLHFACSSKGTDPAVVSLLLTHYPSAILHRTATTQQLPLHLAAEWGVSDPTTLLALLTVYPKGYLIKDSFGKTPLDYAMEGTTATTNFISDDGRIVRNNNENTTTTIDILTHCAPMLLQVSKAAMNKMNWDSEKKIRDMKAKIDDDFLDKKHMWEHEKSHMEANEQELKQELWRAQTSKTELENKIYELRSSRSVMMTNLQESRSQNTHLNEKLLQLQQEYDIKVEKQMKMINELQISLQSKDVEIEETKRVVQNLQKIQQQQQQQQQKMSPYGFQMSENPRSSGDDYQQPHTDISRRSKLQSNHINDTRTKSRSKSPQQRRHDSRLSPSRRKIREDPGNFGRTAYISRHEQSHAAPSIKNNVTVYSDGVFERHRQRQLQYREHYGQNHEESGTSLPSPSNKRRTGLNVTSPRRSHHSPTADDDLLNSLLGSDEIDDDTVDLIDARENDDSDQRGTLMDDRDERDRHDRFDHHPIALSSRSVPYVIDTVAEYEKNRLSPRRSKSTPRQGRQIHRNDTDGEFTRQKTSRRSKSTEKKERFGRQVYDSKSRFVLERNPSHSLSSLSNSASGKPKIVSSTPSFVAKQEFHGHDSHHHKSLGRDLMVGMKGSKSVHEHRSSPTKFEALSYISHQKPKSPRSYFTEMMMSDDDSTDGGNDNTFDPNFYSSQLHESRSMLTSPQHRQNHNMRSSYNRSQRRTIIDRHGFNGYETEHNDMDMMSSQEYRRYDPYPSRIEYD